MEDRLQKFVFEHASVRGEFVDLGNAWKQIRAHHDYPRVVTDLLGEMLAASVLLASNIKFDGTLILQIQGDGPIRLLVAECDSSLHIRATVKTDPEASIPDGAPLRHLINAHSRGRFVITLDMNDKLPGQLPYQGIVSLEGDTLAEMIENYMQQSEQLNTCIWLAADDTVSRGFLLQKLPEKTGEDGLPVESESTENAWAHIVALASTLNRKEILDTDIATLQHRLFWDEDILVFEPAKPVFQCSCSPQKVSNMLRLIGKDEVNDALKEQEGKLKVDCDFCGKSYPFDSVDIARVFAEDIENDPAFSPKSRMH